MKQSGLYEFTARNKTICFSGIGASEKKVQKILLRPIFGPSSIFAHPLSSNLSTRDPVPLWIELFKNHATRRGKINYFLDVYCIFICFVDACCLLYHNLFNHLPMEKLTAKKTNKRKYVVFKYLTTKGWTESGGGG